MRSIILVAAVAAAYAKTKPLGIEDIMASNLPTLFNTPDLDAKLNSKVLSDLHSGRRLKANEDGEFPHVPHFGFYEGITDKGYMKLAYHALLPNSTVNMEQYEDLLTASEHVKVECSAIGEEPYLDDNQVVQKSNVELEITIPTSVAAEMEEALSHMDIRLQPGHVIVFNPHLMVKLSSFRAGGSCSVAIPATSPYFQILGREQVTAQDGSSTLYRFALVPMDFTHVFGWSNIEFEWDPQPEREIKNRLEEGQEVSEDLHRQLRAYQQRRRLAATLEKEESLSINYNKDTKKATTAILDILPGKALYCEECYAAFAVKFTVKLEVCMKVLAGLKVYWYDTATATGAYYTGAAATIPMPPDCVAMGSTSTKNPADPNIFDIALKLEFKVKGDVDVNFQLKSDGVTAATTTCSAATETDLTKATCIKTPVAEVKLSPIVIAMAGIPVSMTPKLNLKLAGNVNAAMTGKFSTGAWFKAAADVSGSITTFGTGSAELAKTEVKMGTSFFADWGTYPFTLEGFNAAGTINTHVTPRLTMSVYDAIPIYAEKFVKANLAVEKGARLLRADRALAVSEECKASGGSFNAGYDAEGYGGVEEVKVRGFVDAVAKNAKGESVVPSSFWSVASGVATQTIIKASTSTKVTMATGQSLGSGCMGASGPVASASPSALPANYDPARVKASFTVGGLTLDKVTDKAKMEVAVKKGISTLLRIKETDVVSVSFGSARMLQAGTATARMLQGGLKVTVEVNAASTTDATALKKALDTASTDAKYKPALENLAYKMATAAGVDVATLTLTMGATEAVAPAAKSGSSSSSSGGALNGGAIFGIIVLVVAILAGAGFGYYKFVYLKKEGAKPITLPPAVQNALKRIPPMPPMPWAKKAAAGAEASKDTEAGLTVRNPDATVVENPVAAPSEGAGAGEEKKEGEVAAPEPVKA